MGSPEEEEEYSEDLEQVSEQLEFAYFKFDKFAQKCIFSYSICKFLIIL